MAFINIPSYLEFLPMLFCFVLLLYYYCYCNLSRRWRKTEKARCPQTGQSLVCCQRFFRTLTGYTIIQQRFLERVAARSSTEAPGLPMWPWLSPVILPTSTIFSAKASQTTPRVLNSKKMFDILGDGIFNADSQLWETHRKVTLSVFHHPSFHKILETTIREKVEKGLLPI